MQSPHRQGSGMGFVLVEVLLALTLGAMVLALTAQSLLLETGNARRLGRMLRERLVSQRALALIVSEVQQAQQIRQALPPGDYGGCGLSGRQVRLHLVLPAGAIIYSVDASPNHIWRGQTLMRCGPAYGEDGTLHSNTKQSSVLVDALAGKMLSVKSASMGVLLQLERSFSKEGGGFDQLLVEQMAVSQGLLTDSAP